LAASLNACTVHFQVKSVQRYDRGRLSRAGVTPTGGARLRANISRTGVQSYRLADGSLRKEYRPADEVFAPDSLASFKGAAITIGHPDRVTPATWARDAVGVITELPERAKLHDGQEYAVTTVDVARADALVRVDSGDLAELSAGYTADFDPTPGVDPVTGEKYDGVQRNIRLNHVALLPPGKARAGRLAHLHTDSADANELRLDADGNQIIDVETEPARNRMKFLLNGKEYEPGPELQAAIGALEASATASKAEAVTQKDRADKAEAAAANAKVDAEKAEAARKDAADKWDAAVSAEVAFRSSVAPILDAADKPFDFAGKSRRDVQLAVIEKLGGEAPKADATDVYVAATFDAEMRHATKTGGKAAPKKDSDDVSLYTDEAKWAEHMQSLHVHGPKKGA
jgi:hypothetical protein